MKNTKRSAFTIVELVIVIAVIAILSAVLIPTFGAIIKDANIAADQTAAATLTTELHVELKGKQITSEEDLMQALTDSGVAEKLVPKSLGYGYHFWFNMETQSIFVAKAEEVEAMPAANLSASVEEPSGAVLASAMLVDNEPQTVTSVFNGIRDIFNKGYILIDSADTLANIFGDMSAIDATGENSYLNYIKNLTDAANNDEIYGIIANAVLNNFKKTVVINGNGVFYFSEAASGTDNLVYFANGVKIISTTHYVYNGTTVDEKTNGTIPTPAGNKISLPSSVVLVEEDALDFGDGNSVVINTSLANENAIANVFAPKSTDAIIKSKVGTEYKVTVGTSPNYPDNGANSDILVTKADDAFVADLIVRLPFENFEIGYETKEDLVEFNTDTLYISNLVNDQVVLFAKDTASDATSLGVYKWESDNTAISVQGGVLSFDEDAILAGSHRATITAYAKNLSGEDREDTLKIEVRIVESATVKIGDYSYPLGQGAQHLSYVRDGNNQSIELVPTIGWKSVTGETLYDLRDGEMTITKADESKTTDGKVAFAVGESEYTFTVSIDGRLETEFTVAIVDIVNSPFKLKFHHARNYSPYYVGSGDSIKLSDLFYTNDDFTFNGATLTVYGYAERGTDLFTVNEINNYAPDGQAIWTDEYTSNITSNWGDVEIQFNTDSGYDHTDEDGAIGDYDVVIEIAPKNDLAMIVHVVVVADAKNVNKNTISTELYTANDATHAAGVILHDDITVTTGNKINLGGQSMYGNGYVITADEYVSSAATNVLTDYLISANGGVIENIYLNGPVYPVLNYDNNNNGFYVSGISASGATTIKNSYVCGFRQPVASSGSTSVLTVKDTTLRGGNYANLLLKDGNLNLHNVTTVQDQNGMQNTVALGTVGTSGYIAKKGTSVTGMGIGLERGALDSTITITGYLDQFNWIKKGQTATLPSLTTGGVSLNVNDLFGFIFDGINASIFGISAQVDMGSVKYFINQDKNQDPMSRSDGYVHAGIVFGELGSGAPGWTESVTINEAGRTDGTIKKRTFDKLSLLFSRTGLEIGGTMVYSAKQYFSTDGLVVIWSHKDNRAWAPETNSKIQIILTRKRLVNPTGGKVNSSLPIYQIGDDTDYPITYSGYNYGE